MTSGPVTSARGEGSPVQAERSIQRAGRDFVFALYAALRALKLYPLDNQTTQTTLAELGAAARVLIQAEGGIVLRYVGDFCFVNDLRLRIDLGSYATFGGVGRALKRHGVGHVHVEAAVAPHEWTTFLSLLLADPSPEDPFGGFVARSEGSAIRHITFGPAEDVGKPASEDDRAKQMAKRTYSQSVAVAREVLTGARIGKGVSLRRVKRAVQGIVDQVLNNETSLLGMTTLRDYDQYTFAHSVNVCIFSVALGKKLGLTKPQLYELGFGALLHDIGKTRMPLEITNKTSALTDAEWEQMQEHPTEGLLALFSMHAASELPLRAMLLAYEHHMQLKLTGYPRCIRERQPTLFSRIVTVADGFDAATSKRSYQSQPWTPDQVLREMRDNPRRGYDPLVVKAFISMTGIYPVGSVVILDTFELALVVATNPRPEALHQPLVKIIFDEMGLPLDPPLSVDLAEVDPATGAPRRAIIKATEPERYGIHVGDYFI